MKNGKLLYSKGFGIADSAKGTPVNVSNIFRIASLSKLITATGIMKLWEEKKLSLDQPVFGEKGILNDSAFLGIKDPRIREITVEHLLRHQGGYSIRAGDPLFCTPSVAQSMQTPLPLSADDMGAFRRIDTAPLPARGRKCLFEPRLRGTGQSDRKGERHAL